MADIVSLLRTRRSTSAIITNIPNRRLAEDIFAMRRLRSMQDRRPVGDLSASPNPDPVPGSDPEDFWALSDEGLCDVRVSCSPDSADGRFDVEFTTPDPTGARSLPRDMNPPPIASRCLATDPLDAAYRQQLESELQQTLRDGLQGAPMPAAVFAVHALPGGAP